MLYNNKKDYNDLHREYASTPQSTGFVQSYVTERANNKRKSSDSLKPTQDILNRAKNTISSQQSSNNKPNAGALSTFLDKYSSDSHNSLAGKTEKIGTTIKNNIKNVLSKKYSDIDTKHLFDDINDDEIEKNIPTAENTIKTNVDRGYLNKEYSSKLPNLRDGLALSYAAAEKGNSKAASRAREAAYTEADSTNLKPLGKILYNMPKTDKPSLTNLSGKNSEPSLTLLSSDSDYQTRYVGGDGVRFRNAPGTGANSIALGMLYTGDEVKFTGQKKEQDGRMWAEVVVDGKKGWVAAEYLKTAKPGSANADSSESKDNKAETDETEKPKRDHALGLRFKAKLQESGSENNVPKEENNVAKEENETSVQYNPYSDPQKVEMQQAVSYLMHEYGITSEHAKIIYYSDKWKDVPEYKWTTGDAAKWKATGGEAFIHKEKLAFIKNYKDVIIDAAEKYDIPPFLLAGVAYIEYGGAPMWIDDIANLVRSFDWSGPEWVDNNLTITKNPDLTSFGNTSIQVRRALEMLGYDASTDQRNVVIDSLKDPIQNIYLAACHLDVLRNVDYKGKSKNDLTDDEIKIIASRYNLGPDIALNSIVTEYGDRIYANKDDILKALS